MLRIVKLICIDKEGTEDNFSVGTTYQGCISDSSDRVMVEDDEGDMIVTSMGNFLAQGARLVDGLKSSYNGTDIVYVNTELKLVVRFSNEKMKWVVYSKGNCRQEEFSFYNLCFSLIEYESPWYSCKTINNLN